MLGGFGKRGGGGMWRRRDVLETLQGEGEEEEEEEEEEEGRRERLVERTSRLLERGGWGRVQRRTHTIVRSAERRSVVLVVKTSK
jgi:hypothetical protein